MTWEVANEPHTQDNFETDNNGALLGDMSLRVDATNVGGLCAQWICRAAEFIKTLDSRHMVASGNFWTCLGGREVGWFGG
jgi:hypothetical protein